MLTRALASPLATRNGFPSSPLHNDRQDGASRRADRQTNGKRVECRAKGGTNSDSDGDERASATGPHV